MRKKEECTIVCASYLCIFLFIESHNITIQHLSVVYSNSRYLPLLNFTPEIPFKLIPFCQQIQLSSGTVTVLCAEWSFNLSATSWMFVWSANVYHY